MNTTKKILCPVDFSRQGAVALEMAATIARERGASLLIVHVREPVRGYAGGEFTYALEEPDPREIELTLRQIVPSDPAVSYEHLLLSGDPAAAIVQLAEEEGAEMIVLATHGRTGLTRMLMGSVAEAVVRRAKCPVLTVKAAVAEPVAAVTS